MSASADLHQVFEVSTSLATAVFRYRIGWTDSWVYINVTDNGKRIGIFRLVWQLTPLDNHFM